MDEVLEESAVFPAASLPAGRLDPEEADNDASESTSETETCVIGSEEKERDASVGWGLVNDVKSARTTLAAKANPSVASATILTLRKPAW